MDLLTNAFEAIRDGNPAALEQLMEQGAHTPVTPREFEAFTQRFAPEEKQWLRGQVNIHGMGGSGLPKVNLTSIACLYLAAGWKIPIVKTGSRKNTGVMGSTDFFEELGILHAPDKKRLLEEFGFAYFDFLTLSPWKAYKPILRKNADIDKLLGEYHFFEYEIGVLGLGVSSGELYDRFLSQTHFPKPGRIFTYFSRTEEGLMDEILPAAPPPRRLLTRQEVSRMDHALTFGRDADAFWLSALRESVALFARELGAVTCLEEGRERFDKLYAHRAVATMLAQMQNLH